MGQGAYGPDFMRGVNCRVALRSFFLEILWNYDKNQNVGFVFSMFPALRRICPERSELKSSVWRQLNPVNTHPSMGPLLAGITARLEQELGPSAVIAYRKRVMAALAAQGDRIFWSHVKPLASVCGALFALGLFGSILGSIATLLVYNVPNIYVRMTGFSKGWNGGLDVVQGLKSPGADRAFMRVRETTSVALGVVAGLAVLGAATSTNVMDRSVPGTTVGAALTILAVLGWVLLRKDVAITPVIYILGVAAVAVFLLLDTGLTL